MRECDYLSCNLPYNGSRCDSSASDGTLDSVPTTTNHVHQSRSMNPHFLNKRLSHQLGYAGLLPFIFMLFGVWFADVSWLQDFVKGQLAYGIVILSFLGGVHWGAGMLSSELSAVDTKKALMWGVTPSLIAWSATLFGGFGFAVLMAGFVAALKVDQQLYPAYGMPDWLLDLRKRLTIVVVLTLMTTVIGANLRG